MIKSPIKWAGGKSFLVERIKEDCNNLNLPNFIDLFTGSSVVALNMPSDNIIANDISYPLITFHKIVKQGLLPIKNYNLTEVEYYANREKFNIIKSTTTNDIELATLFYYLNTAGFNGLYRENAKGSFNIPCGKKKTFKPLAYNTTAYNKINFINDDYKNVNIPKNSLIYIDPPYDTPFTKYNKTDFNWENQKELIQWAINTNEKFIISNQATDRIINLYTNHALNIDILYAPRRVAANGNRDKAKEVYAKNF